MALGLLTGLIILKFNPSADAYMVLTGVGMGSLMPDLDTKKSDPAQIFPPVAWIVDKLTKHRGFTHMMLPLLFIIAHYYFQNEVCWWVGIGGLTHLVLDFGTYALGITCSSSGEQIIFVGLWIGICYVIGKDIFDEYRLIRYIPKEHIQNINTYTTKLIANITKPM
jgi:membrane-bound metal-dependent hydrolase YbcI (DUF457 family)